MRINRSLLNWGVFLIALGGIPLAVDQGWLEDTVARDLGQLWPLILVGIGLGLILRWTPFAWFGGALVAATFGIIFGAAIVAIPDEEIASIQQVIPAIAVGACSSDAAGPARTDAGGPANADAFELDVALSCGELEVTRATDASWSFEASHARDDAPIIEEQDPGGTTAAVDIGQERSEDFGFLGRRAQSDWRVRVPAGAALTLEAALNATDATIDAGSGPLSRLFGTFNASDAVLDLGGATTTASTAVELTANAADVRLLLPSTPLRVSATLNAASLEVCVPAGAALQVEAESILSSDDLAASGLVEAGTDRWTTPGFSSTGGFVDLSVSSTVSSLALERPEACS